MEEVELSYCILCLVKFLPLFLRFVLGGVPCLTADGREKCRSRKLDTIGAWSGDLVYVA